jgi:hypothetical protein
MFKKNVDILLKKNILFGTLKLGIILYMLFRRKFVTEPYVQKNLKFRLKKHNQKNDNSRPK